MKLTAEVIVVGAGPAGSMTAYTLARRGVRVALVDAAEFPRDKTCGGGIQHKATRFLPAGWEQVVRGRLTGASFSYRLGERFTRHGNEPLVHCVMRREFDHFLMEAARAAGAEVHLGVKIGAVNEHGRGVEVRGGDWSGEARFVIGADGANSILRTRVASRSDYFWQAGLSCEVSAEQSPLKDDARSCLTVDWGTLPNGYGWMFPKCDTVNVGVGCPAAWARQLRPYLAQFFAPAARGDVAFRGHQLPTARKGARFSRGRVVLVGDAAGLVEPFTGDGITNAVHSARIAADLVSAGLERDALDHGEYARQLGLEILEELEYAGKLQRLFVAFPHLAHRYLGQNDRVWRAFCGVLRGRFTFRDLRRKSTRSHEWLWAPLDAYAALRRPSPEANPIA